MIVSPLDDAPAAHRSLGKSGAAGFTAMGARTNAPPLLRYSVTPLPLGSFTSLLLISGLLDRPVGRCISRGQRGHHIGLPCHHARNRLADHRTERLEFRNPN